MDLQLVMITEGRSVHATINGVESYKITAVKPLASFYIFFYFVKAMEARFKF
jgi:hypothetical protein